MPQLKHGPVTVDLADEVVIPPQAGALSARDMARIPKAPRDLATLCASTADTMVRGTASFVPPLGVTPESLRHASEQATALRRAVTSLEFLLAKVKQANLLAEAVAWEELRKVNDVVLAQGKTDPEVLALFAPLRGALKRARDPRPRAPAQD